MSKYLELFAKAIGIPQPIERSRYELETNQSQLAENGRREVDSTLEEPPTEEEAPTPEPQKDYEPEDFLLIRDEKVIAVSANEDFNDGDHPTEVLDTDTVVKVICNGNEIPYLV